MVEVEHTYKRIDGEWVETLNLISGKSCYTSSIDSASYCSVPTISSVIYPPFPVYEHPTSCPNCGAPVTERICPYCKTALWH